jgi:hypothetical protein
MYLYDNGLVGEIPTEIGQLTVLKEFWISGNALEGRIPSELGLIRDVGKNGGSTSFRDRDKAAHCCRETNSSPPDLQKSLTCTKIY